jgi:hypothetical protein
MRYTSSIALTRLVLPVAAVAEAKLNPGQVPEFQLRARILKIGCGRYCDAAVVALSVPRPLPILTKSHIRFTVEWNGQVDMARIFLPTALAFLFFDPGGRRNRDRRLKGRVPVPVFEWALSDSR